jgi:hypothetical protein
MGEDAAEMGRQGLQARNHIWEGRAEGLYNLLREIAILRTSMRLSRF